MEKQVNKSRYESCKYMTKRHWASAWRQIDQMPALIRYPECCEGRERTVHVNLPNLRSEES